MSGRACRGGQLAATLLAAAALSALSGCGFLLPRAEHPIAPAVDLVLEDERPAHRDDVGALGFEVYTFPLLAPWTEQRGLHYPVRSLLPEMKTALERSGLFGRVLGPGDPDAERAAAPVRLRIALHESRHTEVRTSYLLGLPGILLHLAGAPQDWSRTTIRLSALCTRRNGPVLASGVGEQTTIGFTWIYEDSEEQENLEHTVRIALSEALEPLFDLKPPGRPRGARRCR